MFPLVVFYACYFWLVPAYLAKRRILTFLALLLVLLNAITVAGYLSIEVANDLYAGNPIHLFYRLDFHLSGLLAMTVAAIFGIAFRSVFGWYEAMQTRSRLEKEKLQSELLLLKAQVNPHFLFNTLNTIDYLIYADQPKASESLIKLSSLLRYVIYETVGDQVPLQTEIEQMRAYVDLQRLRYGDLSSGICTVADDPSGKMVAPMLFMPFIENAFKHTDEAGIRKGMAIGFFVGAQSLEFTCKNHISLKDDRHGGGFGLENVRRRLQMQYPHRHELAIDQSAEVFSVTLKLTLQ
ncbi:histidine kinase [uncultured Acetobacteroides sp.]|uniref:sensor histidine kinase n=1 Tax=uncultured Acetobacteroides sp. TaxID=1760811 RepID=UPI0029F5BA29|nr:histidine kinase [uncultured Acetobacteroides sp.]